MAIDPFLFAGVMLLYTLVLVWLVGRSAGQNNPAPQNGHGVRAQGAVREASVRPTIDRVFPGRLEDEPDNVQNFTRRMRQPSRSRSRTRAPSVVPVPVPRARSRSRTRAPSQPVRRPRSPSRSRDAPAPPVKAAPLLPTISGSSVSVSSASSVPSSSAGPSAGRMSMRDLPRITPPTVELPHVDRPGADRDIHGIPRFTSFRETPSLIWDGTPSATGSGKGKAPMLSTSTTRGSSASVPASSVGTSTLARNFTALSLKSRGSQARSEKQPTPGPSKTEDVDDDDNPFAPRMPVSSASNARGGSPALSVTSFRTATPQNTPRTSRKDFPIVAYDQDGIAIRKCDRTVKSMTTFWYQRDEISDELLWSPPDLTHYPGLTVGDLYYHCLPLKCQFWLWTVEFGQYVWKEILCGYMREDGRYLITTKIDHFPSWVQRDAYRKALEYLELP